MTVGMCLVAESYILDEHQASTEITIKLRAPQPSLNNFRVAN